MMMTWLGFLNFVVLQWFGVRLGRVIQRAARNCVTYIDQYGSRHTLHVHIGDGRECHPLQVDEHTANATVTVGWTVLRWIWPLTGWWSDYRWIARRR